MNLVYISLWDVSGALWSIPKLARGQRTSLNFDIGSFVKKYQKEFRTLNSF